MAITPRRPALLWRAGKGKPASARPLVPTVIFSPLVAACSTDQRAAKPCSFHAGDRVRVAGLAGHPTMIVRPIQRDLFGKDRHRGKVSCTWMVQDERGRPVRRTRHFDPTALHWGLGLAEAGNK